MIRAEIKKIKNLNLIPPMDPDSQRNGQRDRERERNLGKYIFLNQFFENLFY